MADQPVHVRVPQRVAGTAARDRRRPRRIAAGNPLALRELLHGAEPGGLTELVVSRLDSLEPDVRFVVELTACGEPLPVPVLDRLVGTEAPPDPAQRVRWAVTRAETMYRGDGISGRSQLRELLEDPASAGVGGPPNVTA